MSRFVWHVRCADCLAAAVYSSELDAQSWAAIHRCPKTPGDLPAETQPSTTQPKETPA
jgi:hypothetical protein